MKQLQEQDNCGIKGRLRIRKYRDGELVHEQVEDNKVISSDGYGRNLLVRQLVGNTTYGIQIDEAKIGTGTTAPADGDTDLETVVLDGIVVESTTFTNDQCTLSFFILDGDLADGTYEEFGLFIGGQMFSRALFNSPYSKSSGEDSRIDYTITIS